MKDRELYQEQVRAQLNEWKAQIDLLRAKAATASVEAQQKANERIKALENNAEEAEAKLAEIADMDDNAWKTIEREAHSAWESLKSGVDDILDTITGED